MELLLAYLLLGAFAGTAAGLFGIGGGLLIVPVLIYTFSAQGIDPQVLTHLAVGTSLATIVVTSISSTLAHHAKGAVRWDIFVPLALGIVGGSILGVVSAVQISGEGLRSMIGVFAILVGLQMGLGLKPKAQRSLPAKPLQVAAGVGIGGVSSLFGIGGGTLSVPYMTWNNVKMQQAVGTSAACGFPIALVGALTNMTVGWDNPLLPEWSTGFVYWPACLGIVISSVFFARLGAKLAHYLPGPRLKQLFAVLLLGVGAEFIYTGFAAGTL